MQLENESYFISFKATLVSPNRVDACLTCSICLLHVFESRQRKRIDIGPLPLGGETFDVHSLFKLLKTVPQSNGHSDEPI